MSVKGVFTRLLSLTVCLVWTVAFCGATLAGPQPALAVTVEVQGLPAFTAPGACLGLNWNVAGGAVCEETYVQWDTVTRANMGAYRYRTRHYSGGMGTYSDYLDVPNEALNEFPAIYLRACAVVDGVLYTTGEYTTLNRRSVDVGSATPGIDSDGNRWYPDIGYGDTRFGAVGGAAYAVARPIGGTSDAWIYQDQRQGVTSFFCKLTRAVFTMDVFVELHLAELEMNASGQRVFDIYLEKGTPNEVLIPDVDIYALVGKDYALVLGRMVTVSDYRLDVTFESKVGEPVLNGVQLRGVQAVGQRGVLSTVAGLDDDTYVHDGANQRRATQLLLGGQSAYHVGLRFWAVQVPQNATINHAEVRMIASQANYARLDVNIYAHAIDSSPDFSIPPQVPGRPRTTHSVRWQVGNDDGWHPGDEVVSPELRDVIQEIVDRDGWLAMNELSILMIANQGDFTPRAVWALDGSHANRAWLFIEYSERDRVTPTPAPTLTFTPTPSATPSATPTSTPSPTATATQTATATLTPRPWVLHLPLLLKPWLLP